MCLNRGTTCPFIHPPVPSALNKLKWIAPGKSSTNQNATNKAPGEEGDVDTSAAAAKEPVVAQAAEVIST